jgi:serine/threonine protein kinase
MKLHGDDRPESVYLAAVERIDAIGDDFERSWRRGKTPRPEDYLGRVPESEREALLRELRRVEAELRSQGEPPPAPGRAAPAADGYERLKVLGDGAEGIVYQARERRSGLDVALKEMKQFDPAALARFMKGCRTLQNLRHPNLVTVYDVVSDGSRWFFTMELIDGRPFPGRADPAETVTSPPPAPAQTSPHAAEANGSAGAAPARPPDLDALRPLLRQLADGIHTLHDQEILHRDLKPSNVLVTAAGRVVILDMGLATAARPREWSVFGPGQAGTLPYMAPEQWAGRPEEASDWYSFGVMLHQALTGRHPFLRTGHEMPWTRHDFVPSPPSALVAGVPEELDRLWRLCVELLAPLPGDRPTGREVLRRLGSGSGDGSTTARPFLGRERHLSVLHAALADVRRGRTVTVCLHGPSGVGKSALAHQFVEQLRGQEGAVVLQGRCYERESVPYKALDELIDALGRRWGLLPPAQAETLVESRNLGPLVRLFQTLGRVGAVARALQPDAVPADPHEARRRGVAGLHQVLARIGGRRPLVLYLDDLQWGDAESAGLLAELLRPPDAPPLLLLACSRSEDSDTSPFLSAFRRALQAGAGSDWRELSLEELSHEEARELAARLLGSDQAATAATVEKIARESGGSPFFVEQLVQAVLAGEQEVDLHRVIQTRVAGLPADQRRLLEVVAVASRPVPHEVALQAAGLGSQGRKDLIDLQMARLLRGGPAEQQVQTYHDRIRESVLASLLHETLVECHRGLARALAASDEPDPEAVGRHFQEAGEGDQAAGWYVKAADRAAAALAFQNAAWLYQLALELRPWEGPEGQRLRISLADALAGARRGPEAAEAYLAAAEKAEPGEALELRRRAADQFLQCGFTDEGLEVLRGVLGAFGMRLEAGPGVRAGHRWRVFLSLLLERLRLWWQGLPEEPRRLDDLLRSADPIPEEEQRRIDACSTASKALGWLGDLVQSRLFQTRYLRLALRAREPERVAMGLALEAANSALMGGRELHRAEKLQRMALARAERLGEPNVLALVVQMSVIIAWSGGRWREGVKQAERGEALFAQSRSTVAWDHRMAIRHFALDCLTALGRIREYALLLPEYLQDACDRGDHFAEGLTLAHWDLLWLAEDRPAEAEEVIRQAQEKWPYPESALCFWSLYGRVNAALYRKEGRRAQELFRRELPALARTHFLHVEMIFLHVVHLRARVALAAARTAAGGGFFSPRSRLLRSAARDARRIEPRRAGWALPLARLIRAGIASLGGKKAEALALLSAAEDGFGAAEMEAFREVARRRRGELLGGEQGRELVEAADAWMREQGVKNPARFAALWAPGFPESD